MTETLPAPLVPASVILRDFPYMPLEVVRLRDSGLVAGVSPEAFRCAVLLWCVSWHQVPAGSLPDDDKLLAGFTGFGRGVRAWLKHREGALHGWTKCSDGRLYHPVVAEKAIEALHARHIQAYRTECARIKKQAQRTKSDADYPTFDEWLNHYESTGSTRWGGDKKVGRVDSRPGDIPGTDDTCPEMSRSKGREGKGREGILDSSATHSSANTEDHERARKIADALREHGYQVNSDAPAVLELTAIAATDAEVHEAGAKSKSWLGLGQKPLAWVVSRIIGRRGDAAAAGQPAGSAVQIDPAAAARAEADRKLQDALIEARQLAEYGHIPQAERPAREAAARAAHAAALEALGVAA